jgi:hypothetical protein
MKSYNLKSDMPSVALAMDRIKVILKYEKSKAIKIVHGYGSTGVGGDIKIAIRKYLNELLMQNQIKAYIPGEAFGHLLGFDYIIKTYENLLKTDSDYKRPNEGITYIII